MFLSIFISILSLVPLKDSVVCPPTLADLQSDSLTVYVFLLDECLISQFYTPELSRLNIAYQDKAVGFIGFFPSTASSDEDIDAFGKNYQMNFPLKSDHEKELVGRFKISVTPEVAVWDHRIDRLIYRGRIDDSYVRVGKRKLHPKNRDLEDIINRWIDGNTSEELVETQAIGCFINFDNNKK